MAQRSEKMRDLDTPELRSAARASWASRFSGLRFQLTTGQAEALPGCGLRASELARVKTLLRERELRQELMATENSS